MSIRSINEPDTPVNESEAKKKVEAEASRGVTKDKVDVSHETSDDDEEHHHGHAGSHGRGGRAARR